MTIEKKHIAIFASGAGSNAKKLLEHFSSSEIADIALIVCNNPNAGVIKIAEESKIPILLINKVIFQDTGYLEELKTHQIDAIILAGFLWQLPVKLIKAFENKIINIHPALLPAYGGKGMYGNKVHQAVIDAHETQSGISIHLVNEEYDKGKILFQASCKVSAEDSAETLAERIHHLEHLHFPIVAQSFIQNIER